MAYEAARADHHRKSEEKQAGKSKMKRKGGNNMNMNPMDDMVSGAMGVKNAIFGGGGGGGGKRCRSLVFPLIPISMTRCSSCISYMKSKKII